jgi:hypothetical protein
VKLFRSICHEDRSKKVTTASEKEKALLERLGEDVKSIEQFSTRKVEFRSNRTKGEERNPHPSADAATGASRRMEWNKKAEPFVKWILPVGPSYAHIVTSPAPKLYRSRTTRKEEFDVKSMLELYMKRMPTRPSWVRAEEVLKEIVLSENSKMELRLALTRESFRMKAKYALPSTVALIDSRTRFWVKTAAAESSSNQGQRAM